MANIYYSVYSHRHDLVDYDAHLQRGDKELSKHDGCVNMAQLSGQVKELYMVVDYIGHLLLYQLLLLPKGQEVNVLLQRLKMGAQIDRKRYE